MFQIQQVLPNDTVFISIVREPVSQFLSMFQHLELDHFISLEEFAAQNPIPKTRLAGVYGQNQQLWDFGLPEDHMDDEQKIKDKVRSVAGGIGWGLSGVCLEPRREKLDMSG